MKKKLTPIKRIMLASGMALVLAACGGGGEEPTPTLSVEQVQTQAVATFASDQTATAMAMPTDTPTATETASPTVTNTPAATNTLAATAAGVVPTSSCFGLRYVADVTIPDNTEMAPGESFTKTWRVRNSGSCAWEQGFRFRFVGGETMAGSAVTLGSAVQPGSETELSVDLTAPSEAGTYRGNWRMTNSTGAYFGDEVFVQIVVSDEAAEPTSTAISAGSPTSTQAPTSTSTQAPTETDVP